MSKKWLIAVAVFAGVLMMGPLILCAFISRDTLQRDIAVAFKAWSGLELEVQGNTTVEAYPFPHVVVHSLVVHNVEDASAPFFLTIHSLELYPDFGAIFLGKHTFKSIRMDGVTLSLEQLKNGSYNWKKLATGEQDTSSMIAGIFSQNVQISNASIVYTDSVQGTSKTFDNISIDLFPDIQQDSAFRGRFGYGGRTIGLEGKVNGIITMLSTGSVNLNVNLMSGKTKLTYTGEAGMKADNPCFKGGFTLDTDDIAPWYTYIVKGGADTTKTTPLDAKGNAFTALPLTVHASVSSENAKTTLSDLEFSGPIINGKLQIDTDTSNHWQVSGGLEEFNLESVLASKIVSSVASAPPKPVDNTSAINAPDMPLVVSFDVKVKDIDYNNQHIKDAHIAFDLDNNEAVFSAATALFPGNSRIVFNGLGKNLETGGISLEGQIDAAGDDFFTLTRLMKVQGMPLPADDLKRFRVKTNIVVSPSEIRFSELAARIEALAITGGVVVTLNDRPQVQAELRIGGLDLDHVGVDSGIYTYAGTLLAADANRDATLETAQKTLQWLKDISFDLKLFTVLDAVTFNGKVRHDVSADIYITPGKLAINRLKTNYEGTELLAEIVLDVMPATPRVSVMLNADTITIPASAAPKTTASAQATPERWSSTPYNFYWMNHVDSTYAFSIGHLIYGAFQADNLTIKGGLENNTLHVDDMKGFVQGAPFAARLSVRGGRIPAIDVSADIQGIAAERVAPYVPLLASMTGRYTIVSRLAMTGESVANWVSTLNGGISIAGRDVLVRGFNMPGIIRAVAYVRTVADILNVVKHAFPGGDTLFSEVIGNWSITEGKIDISNTKLTSPDAKGVITGVIDLPEWQCQQKIVFDLLALDRKNPPAISIQLRGSMDSPEKTLDTHALEQYVTDKTSAKLLNSE